MGKPDYKKTRQVPNRPQDSGPTADRLPPHSVEMEQGSLGCILLAPNECLPQCIERFRQFGKLVYYDHRHQAIYSTLVAMHEAQKPIEIITLMEELKHQSLLEPIGGIPYLSKLLESTPTGANLAYYNESLVERCLRRRVGATCAELLARIYEEDVPTMQLVEEAERDISQLTEFASGEPDEKHIKEVINGVIADMEQWHYSRGSAQLRGLPTGPPGAYLDNVLMGIRPTDYVTLAGRPGGR